MAYIVIIFSPAAVSSIHHSTPRILAQRQLDLAIISRRHFTTCGVSTIVFKMLGFLASVSIKWIRIIYIFKIFFSKKKKCSSESEMTITIFCSFTGKDIFFVETLKTVEFD